MSPEGPDKDCIDEAKEAVEADSGATAVWRPRDGHAYVIPAGASDEDELPPPFPSITVDDKEISVTPPTVGEIKQDMEDGKAVDITNLVKREGD